MTVPRNIIYPGLPPYPRSHLDFSHELAQFIGVNSEDIVPISRARGALLIYLQYKKIQLPNRRQVLITGNTLPDLIALIVSLDLIPLVLDTKHDSFCVDLGGLPYACEVLCCVYTYYEGVTREDLKNLDLLEDAGIAVFEDCAISLGTTHAGAHVGLRGEASLLSFSGYKSANYYWGGALISKDASIIEYATRTLSNSGVLGLTLLWRQILKVHAYQIMTSRILFPLTIRVLNRRASTAGERLLKPEVGSLSSMKMHLSELGERNIAWAIRKQQCYLAHRRCVANIYYENLSDVFIFPDIEVLSSSLMFLRGICKTRSLRDKIMAALRAEGIDIITSQYGTANSSSTPNLQKTLDRSLQLPTHLRISEEHAWKIVRIVKKCQRDC